MSILINGMEMPRNCADCDCWSICWNSKPAYNMCKSVCPLVLAADARPVVRASWKRIDYQPCGHDYECSSCGWKNDMATHFCPNCGADMREER